MATCDTAGHRTGIKIKPAVKANQESGISVRLTRMRETLSGGTPIETR